MTVSAIRRSLKVKIFLVFYRFIWLLCMPVVLCYLVYRSKHEPAYAQKLLERFGIGRTRKGSWVWIHAVSLGEFRSAIPLVDKLVERGERVIITHFTPAGRAASEKYYADHISSGCVLVHWVPFDYRLAFKRFFGRFKIKYGLVMEVEFWPGMISSARALNVPLFLCNGQYPNKSFERDSRRRFSSRDIVPLFSGVMVKSHRMAVPFQKLGVNKIAVTGEMRFDQPLNENQVAAGRRFKKIISHRPVVTFASAVKGEEDLFFEAAMKLVQRKPLAIIVYVPRKPEEFEAIASYLRLRGVAFQRRSEILDGSLNIIDKLHANFILGDSLGEMNFYISLADQVVVGGGYVPQGSHNIIEPLLLGKPTIVGPNIWTIEFPAVDAINAGVVKLVKPEDLAGELLELSNYEPTSEFVSTMQGSTENTLTAISKFVES
jgi:3-deoxy-D-manno-octulosonic-acid transferase